MRLGKSRLFNLIATLLLLFTSSIGTASGDQTAPPTVIEQDAAAMTVVQAMILGVVEGLTEYLPVSSTGHLLLAERLMGIGDSPSASAEEQQRTKDAADAYTICIQAGAIIAVLGLYFRRVRQMLKGLIGREPDGSRLLANVAAGFIPAAIIGLLFNKIIKACLFGPWPVVAAWFVGGVAILAVNWRNRKTRGHTHEGLSLEDLTWRMALVIGFAQCIAMWPGVSRSLVTIVGGMMVGLSLSAAVEYSFLLGVVTLGAATAYDALKHGQMMLQTFDLPPLAIGLLLAFISAVASVKWMVSYLNRHGLAVFGYYRIAIALATSAWIVTGTQ
ncbi:undecaprenyl-diphosphate phosphatase [uncultured Desulfosarcina sp.]|uniref:undecaprenyl-diphosphate phosphatase n=1 Tax=uncultured Desulfosarcina sp. TaxID=218289 RepID=UPI0029C95B9A|nr:undecaprenyl-diphosphate phosphatase [uncultured Desulfosarcina sp.]